MGISTLTSGGWVLVEYACRFIRDDKEKVTLTIGGTPSSPAAVNLKGKRVRFDEQREALAVEVEGKLGKIAWSRDMPTDIAKRWRRSSDEVYARARALAAVRALTAELGIAETYGYPIVWDTCGDAYVFCWMGRRPFTIERPWE